MMRMPPPAAESLAGFWSCPVIDVNTHPEEMPAMPSVLDQIGNTPLVELQRLGKGLPGRVAAKLEFFNPGSSVKRIVRHWP